MATNRKKVSFLNSNGESLAALLESPAITPRAYVLFAHCFTCSKDLPAAAHISRALTERGFAVLRFDFTGLGNSEGDFANTHFSSNLEDLRAAAKFLSQDYAAPELLIGHSLGGSAVLAVAADIASCKAVVSIAAPSDPAHIKHLFQSDLDSIEAKGIADVQIAGRKFRVKKEFLNDVEQQCLAEKIAALSRPLLLLHSPADELVAIQHAADIYAAAKHPKSFISLHQADHLLTKSIDAVYVAQTIAAWAGRYLGQDEAKVDQTSVDQTSVDQNRTADGSRLADGELIVRERDLKFTQDIYTASHHILADEPSSAGGKDLGLSPYELLAAALGACTAMTLRMYAEHKKIPLGRVEVRLEHKKIHARDCQDCETQAGKLDWIQRRITISGELNEQQRLDLLRIADRCPVHRSLQQEVKVETLID